VLFLVSFIVPFDFILFGVHAIIANPPGSRPGSQKSRRCCVSLVNKQVYPFSISSIPPLMWVVRVDDFLAHVKANTLQVCIVLPAAGPSRRGCLCTSPQCSRWKPFVSLHNHTLHYSTTQKDHINRAGISRGISDLYNGSEQTSAWQKSNEQMLDCPPPPLWVAVTPEAR
jgi:hypothetical protein